jgi:uncharacterized protein (DUF1330 family)
LSAFLCATALAIPNISQRHALREKYRAHFLVRGGTVETNEGVSRERNVVVEFANLATARACYDSQEYQAAKEIRNAIAEADFIIVEGI